MCCAEGRLQPPDPATNLQQMIMGDSRQTKKPLLGRGLGGGAKGI